MESFEIIFWKEPYNPENGLELDKERYLATAKVEKLIESNKEIYTVKFNDIGLDSQFGSIILIREGIYWKLDDHIGTEINTLKWNISLSIEHGIYHTAPSS